MMIYKGYSGHVELDDEAGLFHGEVLDTRDVITFQGTSVEELIQAFRDSIDDYLEHCRKRGEEPELAPYSDMAREEERETEAHAWAEATVGDVADEASGNEGGTAVPLGSRSLLGDVS